MIVWLNRLNASAMTWNLYRSFQSAKSRVIRKSTSRTCVGPRKKFRGNCGERPGGARRVIAGPAGRAAVDTFDAVDREWASAAQEGGLRKGGSNRYDSAKSEAVGRVIQKGVLNFESRRIREAGHKSLRLVEVRIRPFALLIIRIDRNVVRIAAKGPAGSSVRAGCLFVVQRPAQRVVCKEFEAMPETLLCREYAGLIACMDDALASVHDANPGIESL